MIYIKLDESMNLVMTVNEPIYRGDNLNQKITYSLRFFTECVLAKT